MGLVGCRLRSFFRVLALVAITTNQRGAHAHTHTIQRESCEEDHQASKQASS